MVETKFISFVVHLCRILLIKGIVMVCWSSLTPKILEYRADCDGEGRILHNKFLHKDNGSPSDLGMCTHIGLPTYCRILLTSSFCVVRKPCFG
jgi:hypothetical protein